MSRTYKDTNKSSGGRPTRQRTISVRAVRRDPPDLTKLSRALISLALSEAAAQSDPSPDPDTTQTDPAHPAAAPDDQEGRS